MKLTLQQKRKVIEWNNKEKDLSLRQLTKKIGKIIEHMRLTDVTLVCHGNTVQ